MANRVKLSKSELTHHVGLSGIRKRELAAMIGVSRETFSRWLSGKIEYAAENKVILLAKIFKCSPGDLADELSLTSSKDHITAFSPLSSEKVFEMALVGGYQNEVEALVKSNPQAVENRQSTLLLFDLFKAILDLDINSLQRCGSESDSKLNHYEIFDVVARHYLAKGLVCLLEGSLKEAIIALRSAAIQGQSSWLLGFSYLGLAYTQSLNEGLDLALDTIEQGISICKSNPSSLSQLMTANLYLLQCFLLRKRKLNHAAMSLQNAERLIADLPYRFGPSRLHSYQALVLALQGKDDHALFAIRKAEENSHKLPRIHQLESLLLNSLAIHHLDSNINVEHRMAEALQLSKKIPLFQILLRCVDIIIGPSDSTKSETIYRLANGKEGLLNYIKKTVA